MPGPHGGALEIEGVCAYCDATTLATCRLCGRSICTGHEVEGEGICLSCAQRRDE